MYGVGFFNQSVWLVLFKPCHGHLNLLSSTFLLSATCLQIINASWHTVTWHTRRNYVCVEHTTKWDNIIKKTLIDGTDYVILRMTNSTSYLHGKRPASGSQTQRSIQNHLSILLASWSPMVVQHSSNLPSEQHPTHKQNNIKNKKKRKSCWSI